MFAMTSLRHTRTHWEETDFRYDDSRAHAVIEQAAAGDDEGDAVTLPRGLAAHVSNLLAGRRRPDRRGRPRNFDRDICVHYVVQKIRGLGFEATRNVASKTDTACAIVAAALNDLEVPLSEKNVERIWLGVQRSIPAMRNRDGHTELPRTR